MANIEEKTAVKNTQQTETKAKKRHVPFAVVEAYKTIRTNLTFLQTATNNNLIAFTSPEVSDGKSTTAVNVAIAFSQLGEKTLLLDCDLRRGTLHRKIGIENTIGISNMLAGMCTFDEAVKHINDSLDILTIGQIPPNPSELLGSPTFKEFLDEIKKKYSHVIIDTPPINIVSDALIIGAITDGLVLIIREGFSTTIAVDHTVSAAEVANIKILGVIVNGVSSENSEYKYRYRRYKKYSYRYRYGGGYGGKYGYGYGSKYGYGYGYGRKPETTAKKAEKK